MSSRRSLDLKDPQPSHPPPAPPPKKKQFPKEKKIPDCQIHTKVLNPVNNNNNDNNNNNNPFLYRTPFQESKGAIYRVKH